MLRFLKTSLALVVLAGLLAGCSKQAGGGATTSQGAQDIKIGFLVKQAEEPWFQNEWMFAQQAADKYHINLIKLAVPDGQKVLTAIDTLGSKGAQGFVICTPEVKLGPSIVAKAKTYNMKVIAVDDQFIGSDGKPMEDVPYLGIAARKIGNDVGDALLVEMKKRGWNQPDTAACGVTRDELDTARERTAGTIDNLVKGGFPKSKIYLAHEASTDQPGGYAAGDTVLTQHSGVKHWLIFSMNDEGVLGAVRAFEGRNVKPVDIIGIGIGGTTAALTDFKRPEKTGFCAAFLLDAPRHGFQTTEMMYKWIKDGTEPPKKTLTEATYITRDTYEKVMREKGLLK